MKKKKRCPTCSKKMFFDKESKDFVCRRCGYPKTDLIVAYQERHKQVKPIKIFRVMKDKLTGKKKLYTVVEK